MVPYFIVGGYPRLHRIRDVADYFAGLEKLDNLVNDRNRETYWTRVRLPTPPPNHAALVQQVVSSTLTGGSNGENYDNRRIIVDIDWD
jgi:hypothetical protein